MLRKNAGVRSDAGEETIKKKRVLIFIMPSRTKSTETQSKIGFRSRKSRRSVPAKLKDLEDEDLDQYRSENRASVRLDLRHAESGPSPRKALLDSPISNSPLRVLSPRNRTDETQGFNSTCCHLEPSRSPRKRLFQDGKYVQPRKLKAKYFLTFVTLQIIQL